MRPVDPARSRLAEQHPKLYVAGHALAGALFTALVVWGFASIADAVSDNGRFAAADAGLTRWIQAHDSEWGETFFYGISMLGAPVLVGIVVITALAYARVRDWRRSGALVLATASGAGLNMLLKHVFHRGRPEYAAEFIAHNSWSFPSGHSMDSIVGYGMLLFLLLHEGRTQSWRRLLLTGGIVLVFLIGVSRVYLGVHYLTDVVAGWLAGGAWLFVCLTAYRFAERQRGLPSS